MMLLGNCTSIDFLGHKASSSRVYDVKLLAGQTHHAFILALATGRLLVPFGIALNVLSRCGTAKDEWFRHGPPTRALEASRSGARDAGAGVVIGACLRAIGPPFHAPHRAALDRAVLDIEGARSRAAAVERWRFRALRIVCRVRLREGSC